MGGVCNTALHLDLPLGAALGRLGPWSLASSLN
jgi:hypothetical protein